MAKNENEQTELFETDDVSVIQEGDELNAGSVVDYIHSRFKRAEDARQTDELRWLRAYRNYRGLYGSDVQFTETEKSRVFVKVTKTKTLAAYGQINDVLFGNNKFPLTVNPTVLPDGVSDSVHISLDPNAEAGQEALSGAFDSGPNISFLFDPNEKLKPGETMFDRMEKLGPLKDRLESLGDKIIEGPGTTDTTVTFHPAMIAAKKMEKKIHDQLEESGANKQLRHTSFEMSLFGTGIMKGPFAVDKEYPNWDEESGEYDPLIKTVPSTSHVSIWNFYPDPDAYNMDEAEYVVERHRMTRSQMRGLKSRPFFREESIDDAIRMGESYDKKYWEQDMEDDATNTASPERYEVLEFWGFVDTEILEANGVPIPKELKDTEQVNVNAWICNGKVLRLVLNPFKPTRIPYYAVPYELNPYSFFGVGIAENMDDTQTLMNGFMRLAIDNAALSGNLIIEVDETNLVPGQDLSVYPGKIFRRQGGAPGQGIFGTKFPNVAGENMQLFDKARVLADESTGFPSFAHGQTGVSGVGRTASGISMLMSAANGSIRNVVKNVDDYLIGPLGRAFFAFNMQFNFDKSIKGDLEVKASGTESLMANEVRSQRLMQFIGVASTPTLQPFVKSDYIIREIAKSMDLDPDKVTNSLSDAAIQAEILKKFAQPPAAPPVPEGAPQGPPMPETPGAPGSAPGQAGVSVSDTTGAGGGNIGTGTAPIPGEQGFTGT
jgi:hypothetical protein|tara:strand:- start:1456 stop:3609 length:2154 start_codon:yes stop_codon:yes gene_type:complete